MKWITKWLPKTRTSNPISKLVRPIFEAKKIKAVFGGLFTFGGLVMASAVYLPVDSYSMDSISPDQVTIETIITAQPLPNMTGVSQGFGFLHPAVDLTAPEGSPIYPLKRGRVIEVGTLKYGYGRYVILEHDNGLTSLYAHMGKVTVNEGDEVEEKTTLGEVGMTGHTTGPHLHLEVRSNGLIVNPKYYLH
jgi:murein DD-endopeptidase MepM/ murein hydrolase activator NlpD